MSAPQPVAGDPPAGLDWVRVHPVTPVVRGWKVLAVLIVVVMQQLEFDVSNAVRMVRVVGLGPVGAALVVIVGLGFGYAALAWRMTRYAVDDDAIYLQTGVLFRRQRAARLDRIQGIDTIQPLVARLFGLTELKIEVAGGSDSAVRLSFLRDEVAQALRNDLLARAAGVRRASGARRRGVGRARARPPPRSRPSRRRSASSSRCRRAGSSRVCCGPSARSSCC